MFNPQTSPDTGNVTSSPASPVGPLQLDLLGGPTTASSGPAAPRASRSPSRVKEKPRMTIGICGPTSFASSVPDGPLSSWENRLRRRLARTGSTECLLTWKQRTTPAGRSLSQLVPSMRPTDGTVSGLWPTPAARDWRSEKATDAFYQAWASSPKGKTLPMTIALAMWATPTSLAPAKNGNNEAGNSAGLVSIRAHALAALWPTPSVAVIDAKSRPPIMSGRKPTDPQIGLADVATHVVPPGPARDGSSGTTEKPGALNPAFVFWLMGFPPEWVSCAPEAMPSSRKSRRK